MCKVESSWPSLHQKSRKEISMANPRGWYHKVKHGSAWWAVYYTKRIKNPKNGKMMFKAELFKIEGMMEGDKRSTRNAAWFKRGKPVKVRFFARKWKAIDWAWKHHCRKAGKKFESKHTVDEERRERGRQLFQMKKKKELEDAEAELQAARNKLKKLKGIKDTGGKIGFGRKVKKK